MSRVDDKVAAANAILHSCIGPLGVWADPTRYKNQYWTRDFVLAVMPLLLAMNRGDVVRRHLLNLIERQQPYGEIPILFLEKEIAWLWEKVKRSIKSRQLSFMLRRYLAGQLWNLTPGTRDSEILFMVGMFEYARATGDNSLLDRLGTSIAVAQNHIETFLMNDGLVIGCDWRDTMERELGDKTLLTNNALFYHALSLMGDEVRARQVRFQIDQRLWDGQRYLDYPGNERFDPLGGALGVLYDLVPSERYDSIVAGFESVDTERGVTIRCRHNPMNAAEKKVIERTDGIVVWPFIVGFTVLALVKMERHDLAKKQYDKLIALDGFREWYDPATGIGYGAGQQLWSAALFLRGFRAINKIV